MVRIMRVDVSGQKFVFPNECACCGATPDTAGGRSDRSLFERALPENAALSEQAFGNSIARQVGTGSTHISFLNSE
jgi:Fe-S oxidoreductase